MIDYIKFIASIWVGCGMIGYFFTYPFLIRDMEDIYNSTDPKPDDKQDFAKMAKVVFLFICITEGPFTFFGYLRKRDP